MADDKHNKDPLEHFFQKKSDEFDIPFREEDWLKLEKTLEVRDIQLTYRNRTRWLAAASVLIFSMLGYFTYDNHNRLNDMGQHLNNVIVPDTGREDSGELPSGDDGRQHEQTHEPAVEHPPVSPNFREPPLYSFNEQASTPADVIVNQSSSGSEIHTSGAIGKGDQARLIVKRKAPVISKIDVSYPEAVHTAVAAASDRSPSFAAEERSAAQDLPRLSAGFVMAPDLSTVGSISNFYDPGYKIGLSLEYKLSKNWAVTGGIMQSNLRYMAYGDEFNPSAYQTNGTIPDRTVGECLLIDIPVNLKYNFLNLSRSRFYVVAGLSSYIMLNEDYRFRYDGDDTGLQQGWSGDTGTRHWFSNAGLSIGYELDVHPNWSIRAEPYLRLPLREVGWANVNLYSMGSFVSFNYNFR